MNNNKWFQSSEGDGDLSLTLKGVLMSFVPLVLMFLHYTGHDVTQAQIEEIIAGILGAIASIQIVVGLARKLYNNIIT